MSDKSAHQAGSVSFGEKLAGSQAFCHPVPRRHGAGRGDRGLSRWSRPAEFKTLERAAALAYATESMRLTTRLMQLASWLLLHRAVNEGEMSLAQANKEKTKVKLAPGDGATPTSMQLLPERLRELIERSVRAAGAGAAARCHHPRRTRPTSAEANPVERQVGLLKAAFERDRADALRRRREASELPSLTIVGS